MVIAACGSAAGHEHDDGVSRPLAAPGPARRAPATTCRTPTARSPPAADWRRSRSMQAAISLVAAEERLACRRRHRAPAPCTGSAARSSAAAGTASSVSSWRKIACSKATSSAPGSMPSCSTSVCRALLQGPQGVGLAAAAIQRRGQDRPTMLPQRLLGHPCLGDRHHVAMLTRRQPGIEQALLGRQPQLVEPGRLDPPRRPAVQHVERGAAPQLQRPPERHRRPIELAIDRQRCDRARSTPRNDGGPIRRRRR